MNRAVISSVLTLLALSLAISGCTGTPQRDEAVANGMSAPSGSQMMPVESSSVPLWEEPIESAAVVPRRQAEISLGSGRFINRSAASRRTAARAEGDVTLNFDNTAVSEVVKVVMGDILGENYVIDPIIKGTVSLKTSQPVKRDALIPILEELLKMNGAAMSWDGNFYRVAPLSAAVRGGLSPRLAQSGPGYGVQIFPLRYIGAKEMLKIFEAMVPKENLLLVDEHRNLLVLGGTSRELEGWGDTVAIFDVDWMAGYSVGVFPLQYADAKTIGDELTRIIGEHMNADSAGMVKIEALDRLNALLVLTPQQRYLERVRVWIERLDRVGDAPGVRLYTYEVKNRKAAELASVLTTVFGGEGGGGGGASSATLAPGMKPVKLSSIADAGKGPVSPASPTSPSAEQMQSLALPAGGQVRIVADESNNSILVMASARDYLVIESALKRLDVQEMQVLIEASILEVTLTDELSYGLEWYFRNNDVYEGKLGEGLLDLNTSSGLAAAIPGFSYTITGNGRVSTVLNALASDSKLNVISSPSLMVLDNRTARITVGDQVPVRSETATTEGGVIIESIQFKDTGVQLEVTPRINSGGLITMEIRQDVTDVGVFEESIEQYRFRQRNIQSSISIQSGDTVMLGGLITENANDSESGMPFLRDIPLLGVFFGKSTETNRRTELVVLITPRVVKNSGDARLLTDEYRMRMNSLKQRAEQTLAMPSK